MMESIMKVVFALKAYYYKLMQIKLIFGFLSFFFSAVAYLGICPIT